MAERYRVADLVVDVGAGVVTRGKEAVSLSPLTFQLLVVLVRHAPQVVRRNELFATVWPNEFVSEDTLWQRVRLLREALGDLDGEPRYVASVRGWGYKIVAPVERLEDREAPARKDTSASGAVEPTVAARPKGFRKLWWAAGVTLMLAASVAGIWMVRLRTPDRAPALVPVPLTSYAGFESYPSFSPDGSQVAFEWCPEAAGKPCQICVKQIGVEQPVRLTHSVLPSKAPAWSPDGRTIAFLRWLSPTRQALILTPQRGGWERVLAELQSRLGKTQHGPYLAWTPDSKWLVSPVLESGETDQWRWALFLFSVETGEKRRLTDPRFAGGDTAPAFSPDGRTLAFNRVTGNRIELHTLRLGDGYLPRGEPERITTENVANRGAAWTRDGSEIIFSSGTFWYHGLWRVAASKSAKPRRLAFGEDQIWMPAVSRQGNRLAYAVEQSDSNIWRVDLGGAGQKPGIPVKFIASTKLDFMPAYSPDGKRIAFYSRRAGAGEIWVCESDGSNPVQLTSFRGRVTRPRWSPGGDSIAFRALPGGNSDIYVISANGGAPRRLTRDPAEDLHPDWSRDGKWIYFISLRSPMGNIWKMPASGGEAIQIGRNRGTLVHASPDGKWLYYSRGWPLPESVFRMPVEGGEETQVLDSVASTWAIGKKGIYFVTGPDQQGHSSICLHELATGKTRTLATIDRPVACCIDVSPDGRTLLYSQYDDTGRDLMLVENFR